MEVLIKTADFEENHSVFLLPLGSSSKKHQANNVKNESDKVEVFKYDLGESVVDINSQIDLKSEQDILLKNQQLEELRVKTQDEAHKTGYAEGLFEVKEKYQQKFEEIHSLITGINSALPDYLKKNEVVIASIVFESVCKIIGEVLIDKSKSIVVVDNVIAGVDKEKVREIYISQNDFNTINELNDELLSESINLEANINPFIFKVDPAIKYGGCKIKLLDGFLDASIDGQLEILSKSLIAKADYLVRS